MIINRNTLLRMQPIRNMVDNKLREHSVTSGLSEAGYDIRIAENIEFVARGYAERRQMTVTVSSKQGGTFGPKVGRFVLASAMEEFQMPPNLVGIVHDKSSWARQGLSVFNTVIEPGWAGFLTLELVYHGEDSLFIPAGAGIAQVVFHATSNEAQYEGRYQNQEAGPQAAKSSHA